MKEDIDSLSFEEAYKKLEEIVRTLERGECALEKAMQLYDIGVMLKAKCEKELQKAHGKLEKVLNEHGETVEVKLQ